MMRALIIEDSRLARLELRNLLEKHPEIEILGEAAGAVEALRLIEETSPDLLFLDIQLPGKNGFELLEELEHVPAVIFTTAFDKYALQAFEFNTIDYLLKPVSPERLKTALAKAQAQLEKDHPEIETKACKADRRSKSRVFVREGDKCWFVSLADLSLLESKGNYTQIQFLGNRPLVHRPLTQFEEMLDPGVFFRANRHQIININYICQADPWFSGTLKLTLNTGETVEVSRRQALRFREMFGI